MDCSIMLDSLGNEACEEATIKISLAGMQLMPVEATVIRKGNWNIVWLEPVA